MESIESLLGDTLPVYDDQTKREMDRKRRIREMEIFDNLPRECRNLVNYADFPMEPSMYKAGFYDRKISIPNRSID